MKGLQDGFNIDTF